MTGRTDPGASPEGRAARNAGSTPAPVEIRPFAEADRPFFQRVVDRLVPAESVAPRDPTAFADWFRRMAAGEREHPPGAEAFVAADADGQPLGVLTIRPEREYFTGYERAYVEVLVVAAEAEGRGVGQALLRHAETWARRRSYPEISLDVFAGNDRAHAFYGRFGFRPDHVRMVRRL